MFRFKAIVPAIILMSSFALPTTAGQDFTFTSPDGGTVTTSSMRGNVVLMVFSSVQDPQCRDVFKAMESLTERFRGQSVRIYWVSIDLEKDASNEQIKSPCGPAGQVAILRDPSRAAFKSFGGRQMPTIVVLDKQGQMHGQPRGGFNPNSDFVNKIAAIIDGLQGQN